MSLCSNSVLPDWEIRRLARDHQLVTPFCERTQHQGISHGLSPFGYDCRLADEWMWPVSDKDEIDPTNLKTVEWLRVDAPATRLAPGHMVLARTVETFTMPPDVCGEAFGKSTWARCGITLNTTLIEPAWKGTLTLEISNIGSNPVLLTAGLGICQIRFMRGARPESGYSGKYMGQDGVTPPRVGAQP